MPGTRVVLIRCESYDAKLVGEAFEKGLALLGGWTSILRPEEKILLKPNILAGDPPNAGTTTNPAVFQAVAKSLLKAGYACKFGDSPGFGTPKSAARKAGFTEVAEALSIPLANFDEGDTIIHEAARQNKTFTIAKGVLESDALISLPKLKSHGLQKFTGCIKNQFGCIPGVLKGEFHLRLPNAFDFARMLVDLNGYIKPRLYVMDGIMAMEGNGPRGGDMKPMNLLALSTDPVALDAAVCRLLRVDPALVPTIQYGAEAGQGTFQENEIEIVGNSMDSFVSPEFNIDRQRIRTLHKGLFKILGPFSKLLVSKPSILQKRCVRCGVCVNVCPVEKSAVNWFNGDIKQIPVFDYDACIRCYCCQEMCPEKAIILKKSLIRRLIDRLLGI